MSEFIFSILLVYLDDLLVFSSTFEKHLTALRMVLERLRAVGVRLNPEKCEFSKERVNFLGHVVSASGIFYRPVQGFSSDGLAHTQDREGSEIIPGTC